MGHDSTGDHLGDRLLGMLYGVLHATVRHTFVGATIKGWLINLPLFVAVFMLLLRQPIAWVITIVIAALMLRLLYWKARRDGYVRFVAQTENLPEDNGPAVADNQKVATKATGIFSVKDWEEYVLARPAEYWRVPVGDHAIMVQRSPGQFLYQFVRLGSIEAIEAGLLCYGRRPQRALAITYQTNWGPESEDPNFMFYAPSDEKDPTRKERKMFLAFEETATRDSVWRNLLRDGQG